MKIGELASRSGVSIDTIRFWERRGVLPAAPRTASGYREYDESSLARIRLARRLQGLGLTLEEITGALRAHDEGHATCENQRWRLEVALGRIDSRLAELARLRGELAGALADCYAGRCGFAGSA